MNAIMLRSGKQLKDARKEIKKAKEDYIEQIKDTTKIS